MFVDQITWEKIAEGAAEMELAGERVLLPRPEYPIAFKLHAAVSPADESFRALILRYGGQDALTRIRVFVPES